MREECLDHVLILGGVISNELSGITWGTTTSSDRTARLALAAPARPTPETRDSPPGEIGRRDVLGGLIHEYYIAAA